MEGDYYINARQIERDDRLRAGILLILLDAVYYSFSNVQHLSQKDRNDNIVSIKQISRSLVRVEYDYPIAAGNYSKKRLINEVEEIYDFGIDQLDFFLSNVSEGELRDVGLSPERYNIRGFNIDIELLIPSRKHRYYSLLLSLDLEIEYH